MNSPLPTPPLLSALGIRVHFPVRSGLFQKTHGTVKAVDGVDLTVHLGETLAVVGESGSGKSTLGRALLRLGPVTTGSLIWEGSLDVLSLDPRALRAFRRHAQMIFQDPYASLNPRHSAGFMLAEPLRIHRLASGRALQERVEQLLESVGLSPADMSKYPHQFSGGQRQRLAIARALAVGPKLIVADEPVSALDMSVQAQILGLLEELRQRLRLTYVFISHDLGVVRRISNRVLVLYLGHVVEEATTAALFRRPLHPYTEALMAASSIGSTSNAEIGTGTGSEMETHIPAPLKGEIPSPLNPPTGCPFQTRCPKVMDVCRREFPPWVSRDEGRVACWLYS